MREPKPLATQPCNVLTLILFASVFGMPTIGVLLRSSPSSASRGPSIFPPAFRASPTTKRKKRTKCVRCGLLVNYLTIRLFECLLAQIFIQQPDDLFLVDIWYAQARDESETLVHTGNPETQLRD